MKFETTARKNGGSIIITIPVNIVKYKNIKNKDKILFIEENKKIIMKKKNDTNKP